MMLRILGSLIFLFTGAILLDAHIMDSPQSNETGRILAGAVLLSAGLITLFYGLKEFVRSKYLDRQW
jgi:predicted metal-binding membrane protein